MFDSAPASELPQDGSAQGIACGRLAQSQRVQAAWALQPVCNFGHCDLHIRPSFDDTHVAGGSGKIQAFGGTAAQY